MAAETEPPQKTKARRKPEVRLLAIEAKCQWGLFKQEKNISNVEFVDLLNTVHKKKNHLQRTHL